MRLSPPSRAQSHGCWHTGRRFEAVRARSPDRVLACPGNSRFHRYGSPLRSIACWTALSYEATLIRRDKAFARVPRLDYLSIKVNKPAKAIFLYLVAAADRSLNCVRVGNQFRVQRLTDFLPILGADLVHKPREHGACRLCVGGRVIGLRCSNLMCQASARPDTADFRQQCG